MNICRFTKKFLPQSLLAVFTLAASVIAVTPAKAADFDFGGTVGKYNDIVMFDFTLKNDKAITIFSSSSHKEGGFDTILGIWDTNGDLIVQQDDGGNEGTTVSNGVSYNHGWLDSYFTQFLKAGNYKASVTPFPNFALGNNITQGFYLDNEPQGQEKFEGKWEFHILNADQAGVKVVNSQSVPESSSTLGLVAVGTLGVALMLKRKRETLVTD
jgi:hypothetical protein